MTNDGMQSLISEQIDHWLGSWHQWCSSVRGARGYPGTAAGCSMYRASRQHDDSNGALDHAADSAESQAVDSVISRITQPHNAALHMEARCIATARVWRSARVDQADAERIVREAREMLWMGMEREGLA